MRTLVPTEIRINSSKKCLEIAFGAQEKFFLPNELLRVFSPSVEVFDHGGAWDVPPLRRHVGIKDIDIVGNYAIRICFTDGHETGIYSYELLRKMGLGKFQYMRRYLRTLKAQSKLRERKSKLKQQ